MPLARPPQTPWGLCCLTDVSKCKETSSEPTGWTGNLLFPTHFLSHSAAVSQQWSSLGGAPPNWLLASTASCLVGTGARVCAAVGKQAPLDHFQVG